MAEAPDIIRFPRYCIILKSDDLHRGSPVNHNKGLLSTLKKSAIAGAIWIISDKQQKNSVDVDDGDKMVELTSTVAKSFHIKTFYRNIKEISEYEYKFLVSIPHDRRLSFVRANDGAFFQDLLNIKIYDKVTVSVKAQPQGGGKGTEEESVLRDCIVHYIGPVEAKKGHFFGVVFEVRRVIEKN